MTRKRLLAEHASENPFDAVGAVYVVDSNKALLGVVPFLELFAAPHDVPMQTLMRDAIAVHEGDKVRAVVARAHHFRATLVAVIDDAGKFLGAISAAVLLDMARYEHVKDIHRIAGIRHERLRATSDLREPPVRRARHRLPWLLLGLVGSLLAAGVVASFEHALQERVALTFFVPMIVYLADAIGTQTEAIAVRGLSLNRLSLKDLLVGELFTGALIGSCLAALALPAVTLLFGDFRIAVAVALAIAAAGTVATTIGLLLPWLLHRMGTDPALGSGPIATIIQDVLSILIYFLIAVYILG